MIIKILQKMEAKRGFVQIPARSKEKLIGNTQLPQITTLNGNPARLDKYGRLWSPWLKSKFVAGCQVQLSKDKQGFQIEPVITKIESFAPKIEYDKEKTSFNAREGEVRHIKKFSKRGNIWIPKVIIGDIRKVTQCFPDNFIDCIITSPPYWMQRDHKHPSQIGREKTPEIYVNEIATTFERLKPKLKKSANIFLNVGYKYLNGELILIPEMIALEMKKRKK